jgi:hypothetical protein
MENVYEVSDGRSLFHLLPLDLVQTSESTQDLLCSGKLIAYFDTMAPFGTRRASQAVYGPCSSTKISGQYVSGL